MKTELTRADALWEESLSLFPGGVNSPVRAFRAVGGRPLVLSSGRGAVVSDADGASYLDFVGSWGALILGHAPSDVVAAVTAAVGRGMSFGMPTEAEPLLARLIQSAFPSMERMRFVSSGTEAAMSAIRVARGVTGRSRVVKFAGCYHGHSDGLLARAGSGVTTLSLPGSAGVTAAATADTIVLPYNDLPAVRSAFAAHGETIAAVIVEPVAANMGVVRAAPGFLDGLRAVTEQYGSLLIFDEVITGFRVAFGGVQGRTGIRPDLTCLGKIVGGGLPLAVYGGRAAVMDALAPLGPIYQAGTLSGNPVAVAAGTATLRRLVSGDAYALLEQRAAALEAGLLEAARGAGVTCSIVRETSMLTVFFTLRPPVNLEDAQGADTERFARFFRALLARGILIPPSQFEAWFVSTAHEREDIDRAIAAAAEAFREAA
ncbi:MAG TPA: glutamate-1-semialdehyde 2,1-aminomutase [bacterium]|nr:glutamate-1-semialdehyde 2,1-aminomutase [bacterium]